MPRNPFRRQSPTPRGIGRMNYMFYVTCDLTLGHSGHHEGMSNWNARVRFTPAQAGVWSCFGFRIEPRTVRR
jgi:hypothetical protein